MKDARRQTPDAKWPRNGERVQHPGQIGWRRHLGGFGLLSKAASQTGEHSLDVLQLANDWRHIVLVGHPQEHGHEQVGLQLRSRTQCDIDKPAELAISEAAASLGNVGCDRHRCPPTLRNKSESFRLGEPFGDSVDAIDDNTTSLPDLELPKVLHPPLVPEKRSRRNVPDTPRGSGVCHLSVFDYLSAKSLAVGVWRLASGVWRLVSGVWRPSWVAKVSVTSGAVGVWRLASGVSYPSRNAKLSGAVGVWRLASGVSYPSRNAKLSATSGAFGVWRLASGVSSKALTADPR